MVDMSYHEQLKIVSFETAERGI